MVDVKRLIIRATPDLWVCNSADLIDESSFKCFGDSLVGVVPHKHDHKSDNSDIVIIRNGKEIEVQMNKVHKLCRLQTLQKRIKKLGRITF